MPETVDAVFNDRSLSGPVAVTWNEEQVAEIDTSKAGEYIVNGVLEDGTEAVCTVIVANVNWVENSGFEEKNTAMWEVTYEGDKNPTDVQTKSSDAFSGENSFHFWSEAEQNFTVSQTISGLTAGDYTCDTCWMGSVADTTDYGYLTCRRSGYYHWYDGKMCSKRLGNNG